MLRFFVRHWRGETRFWVAFFVSLIVPVAVGLPMRLWLGQYTVVNTPHADIAACAAVAAVILVVVIWQLVGTWRASSKGNAQNRWFVTRWLARSIAVAWFVLAIFLTGKTTTEISQLYAQANDRDWIGAQPHQLTVESDKIVLSGTMSWGAFYEFSDALRNNPQIQTVVLNSGGGHYAAGVLMEAMIKTRGADTTTTDMCASACTVAFLGGNRRVLGSGAKLGYHSPYDNTKVAIDRVIVHMTEGLKSVGASDGFIQRVFATPGDSVWFPTVDELRENNIVTEIE